MKKTSLSLFLTFTFLMSFAQEKTITLMAVGDMMLGTTYPSRSYLPPNNAEPFKNVQHLFDTADVLFGNFEGTLTDTGKNAKHCKDPSKCYSFKSPESFGSHLATAGFDVLSIANNHIGDFGLIGIKNTKKVLDKHNIAYAGIYSKQKAIFKKNGVVYGFVAFSPNKDCLKINEITKAKQLVRELSATCDIVIVSFHGGAEGLKHKNVPRKTEYFYGENRGNVYTFAHAMIDEGADVILGHGPHIPRAIEVYKNKFIAYSLGNFATYKRFSLSGSKGYSPIVGLQIDEKGNFLKGKIHSAKQKKGVYPYMDSEQNALKEIKKLTHSDFPESNITFENDGTFFVK